MQLKCGLWLPMCTVHALSSYHLCIATAKCQSNISSADLCHLKHLTASQDSIARHILLMDKGWIVTIYAEVAKAADLGQLG